MRKKEWKGEWRVRSNVGALEDEYEVFIHPVRNDHFAYTEIAPFPQVEKSKLMKDSSWESHIWYSEHWDDFSGTSDELYTVMGQKKYSHKSLELDSCWVINSVGIHSQKGKNYHDFLFHPEHGFVEMKYTFFDRTRIEYRLVEIFDKKKDKK